MNAIAMYVLAEAGPVQWLFSCFFIQGDPDRSLANILWPTGVFWGGLADAQQDQPSHSVAVLIWTLAYTVFWMVVSYAMWRRRYFVTI